MQSGWVDRDAQAIVDRYAHQGVGPDLALRIYSTRLLGRDPKLVLHGGGNTSVKTVLFEFFGEEAEVLCGKSSGADMAGSEPSGFPAVRLRCPRTVHAAESRAAQTDRGGASGRPRGLVRDSSIAPAGGSVQRGGPAPARAPQPHGRARRRRLAAARTALPRHARDTQLRQRRR